MDHRHVCSGNYFFVLTVFLCKCTKVLWLCKSKGFHNFFLECRVSLITAKSCDKVAHLFAQGSGTLSIPKCPWETPILCIWNNCSHAYTTLSCPNFLNITLHMQSRAFWISQIYHTSQWGRISFANLTPIPHRPRKRYPFWQSYRFNILQYSQIFFYQRAILWCHQNPVANCLQGPK